MDPNAGKKELINRLSPEELKQRLEAETFTRRTVSFYKYVLLDNPQAMRDQLFDMWRTLNCLGRIYVSHEGINAQMNVPEHNWTTFAEQLYTLAEFKDVPFKIAVEDDGKSFIKLTVKVRQNIVADGLTPDSYDVTNVGKHLNAQEWNAAMDSGKAIVVDIRNHYESEIGHFDGALLPQAETFKEELPEVLEMLRGKEEEQVLLYCTGGIRCEKTSAYLKHHGFKNVNQLHGGIIDYARQIKQAELPNKFKGKNFVFDERLGETIGNEVIAKCHQCGETSDIHVNCANKDCNLLFIQCAACAQKMEGTCSADCQKIIHLPAEDQKKLRQKREQKKRFFRYKKMDLG